MAVERVILTPNRMRAAEIRRFHADGSRTLSFGVKVTTLSCWIDDLWSVWGDGRRFTDVRLRRLLIKQAIAKVPGLEPTAGAIRLVGEVVEGAAGVVRLPSDRKAVPDAGPAELQALDCARIFAELAAAHGLIERGDAIAHLAESVPSRFQVTLIEPGPLSGPERFLLESLSTSLDIRPAEAAVDRAAPGVEACFLLPGGAYAQPRIVADFICERLGATPAMPSVSSRDATCGASRANAFVTSVDPLRLYEATLDRLSREGIAVAVIAVKHAKDTNFGRALLSLRAFSSERGSLALGRSRCLTDFLLSPFSGYSLREAYAIDAAVRADRLMTVDACMDRVIAGREESRYMSELVEDLDADILCGYLVESVSRHRDGDEAYRQEQISAIRAWRQCAEAVRFVGGCIEDAFELFSAASIDVSRASGPDPRVVYARQEDAAGFEPGRFDVVVACDMTTSSYPVKDPSDAARTLLGKLGVAGSEPPIDRQRRRFMRALRLAKSSFAIERPLNDEAAAPAYPCAVLQEYLDACKDAPDDRMARPFDLPASCADAARSIGEDALYENVVSSASPQKTKATIELLRPGEIAPASLPRLVLRHALPEGGCAPVFSPSQIERYLECPYRWFVERRVNPRGIDEGFGPLEKGDFAHAILHDMYAQLISEGVSKVTDAVVPHALDVLDACFDARLSAQRAVDAADVFSSRLIATSEMERREVGELRAALHRLVRFEPSFLPHGRPVMLERRISLEDGVAYAGVRMRGTIDRVDATDAGCAVVVDYKGSATSAHDSFSADGTVQGKVQTLIYAQMIRRSLGLDVGAAVYLGYRDARVAGAFDARRFGPEHFPGIKPKGAACGSGGRMSFEDLLDATEERVARALSRMQAGDIAPAPVDSAACAWCVASSCSRRRG